MDTCKAELVLDKWNLFDDDVHRLEDVVKEALWEAYDIERANNAMHRLSIYHIAGHVRLMHRDRMAIYVGFLRYLRYLVFELRTE